MKPLILALASLAFCPHAGQAEEPAGNSVREAVDRGLGILRKAAANYPEHRTCFSCHHQTLPMLAMREARAFGATINADLLEAQAEFTRDFYKERTEAVAKGEGVGGRSTTVVYSLWALDLAGRKADNVSDALVSYLLNQQEEAGGWTLSGHRPPLQESHAMTNFLAAYYMNQFSHEENQAAIAESNAKTMQWFAHSEQKSQEDWNARLWALTELGGEAEGPEIDRLRTRILELQRADGGWSQEPGMESDAYATGQTLFVLRESGLADDHPACARGLDFLLQSQKADGSWLVETRAKPVQKFFDNGDPHGKSQFISIAATGWAVAALCRCGRE
jgi:N-acyl-D-amino-acid deacylase